MTVTVKGSPADAEQVRNITLLFQMARQMGATPDQMAGANATMTQESACRNIQGGDRDSAGLFQQRPSCGWGSYADVTNPTHAIKAFLTPYLGYCKRGMDPISASNQVQRSAYPQAPAQWMAESRRNVSQVTGSADFGDTMSMGALGLESNTRTMPYEFSRGTGDTIETSWDCMGRLAQEVSWDRFMSRGVLWFVSEDWLKTQTPRFALAADTRGVISITFSSDGRTQAAEATVQALARRWAAEPGDIVRISGQGPGDGLWICSGSRRDMGSPITEISLRRPVAPTDEPANDTTTTTTVVGGIPSMSLNPSAIGGAATGGSSMAQRIYNAAAEATAMNWRYSQGMRNSQRPNGYADCSSGVSWVLNRAGVHIPGSMSPNAPTSGMYETWGVAGPGQWVTVECNGGHVWIRFTGGVGPAWRFDTSAYGDSYTGSSGGRLRKTARPTTGFVARHWPGT
jgi:hypothetical protein